MLSSSQDSNPPRTPTRRNGGDRTCRTPNRTPNRQTPNRISFQSKAVFKAPKAPDFVALAQEQRQTTATTGGHNSFFAYNPEKEPIKAYLRIRPQTLDYQLDTFAPYLHIVDDLEISMTPPEDSNAYRTRNRAPERYKFSKIFTESVPQQEFFNKTTLPLIHDVLRGENALIFAYGVTNSGKTFSIMGTKQNPGILPRTLDVIFNSIDEYKSDSKVKPCMHSNVQGYKNAEDENRDMLHQIHQRQEFPLSSTTESPDIWDSGPLPAHRDKTAIAIDQNYEYGIWVSFVEIYTEKIYDLLVQPDRLLRKRKALALKYEYTSGHKYIAGLKEVKVKSIQEAYAILLEGQKNRAEYSTITNHTSSRSHSVFTIRVVRVPIDDNDYIIEDPTYASVSKLSIVDLAGSERYRNTLNSGQRLKEAGNINKSLMVLGQCMETLRLNQLKSAIGKKNAMVPYRHSKLTELFKSSFEGDGKAVMVVNVNPFDTGFDENSHVMKFSAVAKDVATWRRVHPKLELRDISQFVNKRLRTKNKSIYYGIDSLMKDEDEEEEGQKDDGEETEEEDEDTEDPFVDNLIAQLDDLRNKWIEAETRCTTMEADIRQQVTKETEAELKKMEEIYMTSLKRENDLNQTQLNERLNSTMDEGDTRQELLRMQDNQKTLSIKMEKLCTRLEEHESSKHRLLEKISQLEKDKQKQQESIKHLNTLVKERDETIEALKLSSSVTEKVKDISIDDAQANPVSAVDSAPQSQQINEPQPEQVPPQTQNKDRASFEKFLDLRKRLRRSIFRGEEYSHDADIIMGEIEQFTGVSFELVKETSMGKLMKLITERSFKNDPYNIHNRSRALLKRYAKLSIPILAPKKTGRESMIVLSVNAGREEELITEMRSALSTLQEENSKLRHKLKLIQEGHRRLKEAFDKTRQVETDSMMTLSVPEHDLSSTSVGDVPLQQEESADVTSDPDIEMFSPILGASVAQATPIDDSDFGEDGLTAVNTIIEESQEDIEQPPIRIKKRRKLREY